MSKQLIIGALVAGAIAVATPATADTVNLKFATFLPPQIPIMTEGFVPWLETVEADSEGTLNIDVFAGGSLVRHPDRYYSAVRDNVAEIGFIVGAYTPGQFPDERLLELPLTAETPYEASVAMWRLYERGLARGYDDVKVLGFLGNGPNALLLTEEVTELDKIAGRQLRVSGSAQTQIVEALAATPVSNVPPTQAAEAMSRGLVEGTLSTWSASAAFRTDQVAQQAIDFPLGFTVILIAMNRQVWDDLPEPARAAFERHSGENLSAMLGEIETGINATLRDRFIEGGAAIHTPEGDERAQWEATLAPVVNDWVAATPDVAEAHATLEEIIAEIREEREAGQ